MTQRKGPLHRLERILEQGLFASRWAMAPFYVGLAFALLALLYAFVSEAWHELAHITEMDSGEAIIMVLSLVDLSLAANLVVIVIFSGYENFVSKIDTGDDVDRPDWMGKVDFSGLKMKLMASIVAISAIALLKAFMEIARGETRMADRYLIWLVVAHIVFVVSSLLLATMDWVANKAESEKLSHHRSGT